MAWAENNRYNIERTEYFQCLHGALEGNDETTGENISGIENLQHHCIDYSRGKPHFVRGTYLMVMNFFFLSSSVRILDESVVLADGIFRRPDKR
jgi:hypothetical protein